MVDAVNEEHIARRLEIIDDTLREMKATAPPGTMLEILSNSFTTMIYSYRTDAGHFLKSGDFINAFAAVNYLWGWIDCGKETGLFTGNIENKKLLNLTDVSAGPSIQITEEKLDHYMSVTRRAMIKMKDACPARSYSIYLAAKFSTVIDDNFSAACQFYAMNQFRDAFATVNYAHAWIDIAARIGLYDVDGDDQLFTLFS